VEWSAEVEAFLDEPRFAVLATTNPDGTIHQTVMWYRRDGGNIIMNTRKGRRKPNNLDRDNRASFCIEDEGRYLALTGIIEIDEDREKGVADMGVMTLRYEGPEKTEQLMRDEYTHQHRIVMTFIPETINANGFE